MESFKSRLLLRIHGELAATYESVSLRTFKGARTEVARLPTAESAEFVRKVLDRTASDCDKASLLRNAVHSHSRYATAVLPCN